MRIERILVPTDFSENSQVAFERAYSLARQLGAKLYVLHIQDGSVLRTAIKRLGVTHRGTMLSRSVRIFGGAASATPVARPSSIVAMAKRPNKMLADETRPFAVNGVTMALLRSHLDGCWRRVGRRVSRTEWRARPCRRARYELSPLGRARRPC